MDKIKEVFDAMLKPFGSAAPSLRRFIVDYRDKGDVDRFVVLNSVIPDDFGDDITLSYELTNSLMQQGCTIDMIVECLDGYNPNADSLRWDKLENYSSEYARHTRIVFCNVNTLYHASNACKDMVEQLKREKEEKR